MNKNYRNKILTLSVLATLLAGSTAFAATADHTVTKENDAKDPYTSITVNQNDTYNAGTFANLVAVADNDTDKSMNVCVTDGAQITVNNDGSNASKTIEAGVYSYLYGLNFDHAIKVKVNNNFDADNKNLKVTGGTTASGACSLAGTLNIPDGSTLEVTTTRNSKVKVQDITYGAMAFALTNDGKNIGEITLGKNVGIKTNITSNSNSLNTGIRTGGKASFGDNLNMNLTTLSKGTGTTRVNGIHVSNSGTLTGGKDAQIKLNVTSDNIDEARAVYAVTNSTATIGGLTNTMNINSADNVYRPEIASLMAANKAVINVNQGTNNVVKLEGDIVENDGKVNVNFNTADSYLQGNAVHQGTGTESGIKLNFSNGATWKPVYDNRYGTLNTSTTDFKNASATTDTLTEKATVNLDGGVIDLAWDNPERKDAYRTLNIDKVTGSSGKFVVNTNMAKGVSDKINLGSGSTLTSAAIAVKYDPYLSTHGLTAGSAVKGNLNVLGGAGAAKLAEVKGVSDTYNLYDYLPNFTRNSDGTWSLTNLAVDPHEKASSAVRIAGEDGLSLNSMWLAETNNMQARMGELRGSKPAKAGVWARYKNGKVEQADSSVQYNMFQGGIDKESKGAHEHTYRGFALSHANGNSEFNLGSGDLSETSLSLYQTGVKNNGFYYDVIAKAGKYNNDYDITNSANKSGGDYSTWSYGISGEIGMRKNLAHGLYVEPQAELILGHINGASYTTKTGMETNLDAQNKVISRLGLAVGKEFKGGNLYGRLSYYHDFSNGVQMDLAAGGNSMTYTPAMARNWGVLSLGGNIKAGKSCNVYGEVSKYLGQLSGRPSVNVGVRWSF